MPATQSAIAAPACSTPVRRFQHYDEALEAMADYQAALCSNASRRRSNGLSVTDQDQPEEAFCLFPARPDHAPLAIIGGMGPLAGALAFAKACARFRNSRPVVLYQACSLPDRSTVILNEASPVGPLCHEIALQLADAVRLAADLVPLAGLPARCIIACNSAHYFWRLILDELLRRPGSAVRLVSLVETSLEQLRFLSCARVLLLTTEDARAGQVFSAPLRDAGINFEEPPPTLTHLLRSMIFEGMKSLNECRALELGNKFFEAIQQTGRDYDCILAGCTELPVTLDLLRLHGSSTVAAFLSFPTIVDPLEEALRRV